MSLKKHVQDLTVIILTYNEQIHIRRAILSALEVAREVIIVDSYSTDDTLSIARGLDARVLQNPFINYAHQFQWAMEHGHITTAWTMRLDADEYLTNELIEEIQHKLPLLDQQISGIVLKRRVYFMGKWIRHGGYYPTALLRIWRTGHALIEQRWMDEHMVLLKGMSESFDQDFIDENNNTLSWWTSKHNEYATREAIDILNARYHFLNMDAAPDYLVNTKQAKRKRWQKNKLYLRLPLFFRCFLYFQYRYWIQLGFLDGKRGLVWHFLQGFWYRFLVDAKIMQIEWWAAHEQKSVRSIIIEKYNWISEETGKG